MTELLIGYAVIAFVFCCVMASVGWQEERDKVSLPKAILRVTLLAPVFGIFWPFAALFAFFEWLWEDS